MTETETQALPLFLLIPLFAVAFVAFWCLVVFLISRLGGWASLAADFATDRPATGEAFSWTSGKIHFFSNYGNCLIATVSRNGIDVRPSWPFRIGHRPVFIPWSKVEGIIQGTLFFNRYSHIAARTPDGTKSITLYGRALQESIARHVPPELLRRRAR